MARDHLHENPEARDRIEQERWDQLLQRKARDGAQLLRYRLSGGWFLSIPAVLRRGDGVMLMRRRRTLFGHKVQYEGHVVAEAGVSMDDVALADALEILERWVLTPATKGVKLLEDGRLAFGIDATEYAELKDRLGHGLTRLPLSDDEQFSHGRLVFFVAGSHAWQRGMAPGQVLS
ncbi:MAG: hypothetical protein GC155_06195 [Alphaproteobacteria bacterium]|nr:hypothetical protein [Alphaproteobacteria bacterium]